jgi:hypothetical protein
MTGEDANSRMMKENLNERMRNMMVNGMDLAELEKT